MKQFTGLLAGANVGVACIDTRLRTSVLTPGELIQGYVYIHGGEVTQMIDGISLSVTTECTHEVDDATWSEVYTLASQHLANSIRIGPTERMLLPFAISLPYETPLTLGRQRISLHTSLGIAGVSVSKHSQILHIRPHPVQRQVLDALAALHFQLTGVECRYQPLAGCAHPIVQELEFLPTGVYRRAIEEIEVIFEVGEHGLDVLIEIDRRARRSSNSRATPRDLDTCYERIHVPHTGLDRTDITGLIEQAICETVY
jgi:sporulation-control protein